MSTESRRLQHIKRLGELMTLEHLFRENDGRMSGSPAPQTLLSAMLMRCLVDLSFQQTTLRNRHFMWMIWKGTLCSTLKTGYGYE